MEEIFAEGRRYLQHRKGQVLLQMDLFFSGVSLLHYSLLGLILLHSHRESRVEGPVDITLGAETTFHLITPIRVT